MSVTAYPKVVREERDREGGLAVLAFVAGFVLVVVGAILFAGSPSLGATLVVLGLLVWGAAGTWMMGAMWLLAGVGIAVVVVVLGLLAQVFA